MIEPRALLAALDLTEAETEVYLAMLGGALAARDIIAVTGRSRPTVYYALSSLERRGLLSKTGLDHGSKLRLEPLKRLQTIVTQKQHQLEKTKADLEQFVGQFQMSPAGDHKPQVAFYEGVDAVKNVIMESAYCHGRSIDTLVPTTNFFWQLGEEFVGRYVKLRHDLGVSTRNLWGVPIDPKIIAALYDKSQIRMMPGGLGDNFRSTVFMYDGSVLYISSLASGYALLVKSAEHYQMMQALYNVIWTSSKPLT